MLPDDTDAQFRHGAVRTEVASTVTEHRPTLGYHLGMTAGQYSSERRQGARLDGNRIAVTLRPRGRLAAVPAHAVDFNRFGIAVHTASPLEKDRVVYLTLRCEGVLLENLVGVVHNCVRQGTSYRSGIAFRPSSELQHDRRQVATVLATMEVALSAAIGPEVFTRSLGSSG